MVGLQDWNYAHPWKHSFMVGAGLSLFIDIMRQKSHLSSSVHLYIYLIMLTSDKISGAIASMVANKNQSSCYH